MDNIYPQTNSFDVKLLTDTVTYMIKYYFEIFSTIVHNKIKTFRS